MYDKQHGLYTLLQEIFERNHITPNIIFEAPSAELVADCVINGIGVGFVPIKLVAALIENRSDIDFLDFGIHCPLSVKYNGTKKLTPAIKSVINASSTLFKEKPLLSPVQ